MIEARNSIRSLLETVQEQQEQFTNIASLCATDAAIPVAFTKDNRVHIGPKMEMRVVALGLDGAGKTSILFKMKQDEFVSPITTIGNSLFFSFDHFFSFLCCKLGDIVEFHFKLVLLFLGLCLLFSRKCRRYVHVSEN